MGTNYYVDPVPCPNACEHCRPFDRLHIGKSLVMFAGYRDGRETPWGEIQSWQDWKRILTTEPVKVMDEYGAEWDTAEFIARVEATDRENRERQYRWCVTHGYAEDHDWLCPDGFSFYNGEFS